MRVILVGDSTMAPRTGYGDALCGMFKANVTCINLARGGRSSGSFRAEGLWDNVMGLLRQDGTGTGVTVRPPTATYVLIQFGHNDQPGKPGRSTDLATEFPVNMARYVDEVQGAGAVAVLVTPLTRRTFRNNVLQTDLKPWADATRSVAESKRAPLLELNAKSAEAIAAMGSEAADTLAMAPPPGKSAVPPANPADNAKVEPSGNPQAKFDHTHLGPKGAAFFASMVARELGQAVPALAHWITADRPQLTPVQASAYSYAEVLKYVGAAGNETVDPWDPLSDPLATGAALKADYVVDAAAAADGKTIFNTVQSAVSRAVSDSAASGRKNRLHILVKPGVYRELVYVPASASPITLYGNDADAAKTRITATLDAAMTGSRYRANFDAQFAAADPAIQAMHASLKARPAIGTPGSAVAWIRSNGFQARNLTFENAYNKDVGDADPDADGRTKAIQSQAVALMVDGADKTQFENVRFIGFQDTLYLKAPAPGKTVRSFFNKSYIEGDMDFIFGDATAYFHQSEIRSLGDRRISYVTAPSTHYLSKFGFVFNKCRFTHDGTPNALAGTFRLGRQWFRGQRCTPYGPLTGTTGYQCSLGTTDSYDAPRGTISKEVLETVGKVVILNSRIGAHIDKAKPWSEWNARGTRQHRPVQYTSDDFWANLVAASIDPVRHLGYAERRTPVDPFLAEYRNSDE